MFQKGDLIVYGNMGVCRVEAVEAPAGLPGAGEKKLYYKLDPVYETGTVYIPVDAKVFMRPILTHAQAEALIGRIPEIEENPCGGKDQQMLAEHYRSLMRTHDCDDLVQLIKTIYGCCFSKRMRKVFRKNEKSMLQNCNKKAKRKRRLQRVKKPM